MRLSNYKMFLLLQSCLLLWSGVPCHPLLAFILTFLLVTSWTHLCCHLFCCTEVLLCSHGSFFFSSFTLNLPDRQGWGTRIVQVHAVSSIALFLHRLLTLPHVSTWCTAVSGNSGGLRCRFCDLSYTLAQMWVLRHWRTWGWREVTALGLSAVACCIFVILEMRACFSVPPAPR